MSNRRALMLALILLLAASLACQFGSAPETESAPQVTPSQPPPTAEPVDLQATADAQHTAEALETVNAQATNEAAATASVAAEKTQQALDRQATATQVQAVKQASTAEAKELAVAMSNEMESRLQPLVEEGYIPNTDGEYHRLEDFDESWAQINYFDWWETDFSPENFALYSQATWSSASDKANWNNTGCGYVFGFVDIDNYYAVFVKMDGFADLYEWMRKYILERARWGEPSMPEASAEFLLLVYNQKIILFVNEQEVLNVYGRYYKGGDLAFSLVSGTNSGYGTRCQMTNNDLWIFK